MNILLPDTDVLRDLLNYDPATGVFTWKERPLDMFATVGAGKIWNTKRVGKPAGCINKENGYFVIVIFNTIYYAHRIAWKMHYGKEPPEQIDHGNNDKLDNRINNLRAATRNENQHNSRKSKNNTSGFKGVFRSRNKWRAQIYINNKPMHIGTFTTPEDAHAAYCAAAKKLHREFANYG